MSEVVTLSCHIMTGIIVEIFSFYLPLQSQRAAVIWCCSRHLLFVPDQSGSCLCPSEVVKQFRYNTNMSHFDLETKAWEINQYLAKPLLIKKLKIKLAELLHHTMMYR